jgi:uncharacterized repeat protein (TIGR01451 family)
MMIKRGLLPVYVVMILVACMVMVLLAYLDQGSSAQSYTVSFPLGLMGPSGDTPPELGPLSEKMSDTANGGFNIVYEFRGVQEINEAEDYLNQADQMGLKVIQNLPRCRAYEHDHPICQQHPVDLWGEAEWATFISTLATYDNLVAWYLPDEITDFEAAANLYEWVHTYDPLDRPVYANPGSPEQSVINQFPAFTDFLWAVSYPELGGEPRALTTHMVKMDANACRGTDTRWGAILQFFDSIHFPEWGTVGHPTPHELRSDSYQAIIGGARGLWYFNYEMGKADGMDEQWDEIVMIADEIIGSGGLDEVILAPDVPQGIESRIVSGPAQSPPTQGRLYDSMQFLQKWHEGDGTYLFAVNIATDTVEVEFSNLWAETDTVEVLFEGRTIPIADDAFSDTFAQDDVHIYYYAAPQPAAPLASLTITGTDSPDPVAVGNSLSYTVTVTNDGPSVATGVTLTDTLPAGVTFGSATTSRGSCSRTGPVTCNLGTLNRNTTATLTIVVIPTEVGTITNVATLEANEIDFNMADNTATEETAVYVRIHLPLVFRNYG